MKKVLLLFCVNFFLLSFSSFGQETTAIQQVITAHDEVMAKMPNLVQLINKLQPKVDSTKTGQKYQSAIDDLKASNSSMMTWMRGFGNRFTADEMLKGKKLSEEKQLWVAEEKKKIQVVCEKIDSSIRKAKELLKE